MEYTINRLAKLAGVSTRTLRYYDELGLLCPARISSNGYRVYGQKEIDLLKQILLYRELGVPLEEIKKVLSSKEFDGQVALENHLSALRAKQRQLSLLIDNVEKTIKELEGEIIMSDQEKFKGFIKKQIDDNEKQYGKEIRAKFGNEKVDRTNDKLMGMSKEQHGELENLTDELNKTLKAAFEQGDASSELAKKTYELHKKWLCFYWGSYNKEAHMGVAQMYVDDPRFTNYYDKIAVGCAAFLRDVVFINSK
ncbi:MerR family transcriptional regulator [Alkalibacter saccharofermentans]|uniref:DNA-binding transcriptional regulator, MerR family n=1 Tax=Alkalibacter saccharofermentans DSM 14828 TaxID=1120975 RepID=A0A1M4ZN17_9FIRM|nr:MerR family transcriptional regulator [Alkalibacter saccharofermentans]SHF19394.1 DNA-binding transcriptional regulator, MerR family [Alkalibacter saccharofermentans DSM 14828]